MYNVILCIFERMENYNSSCRWAGVLLECMCMSLFESAEWLNESARGVIVLMMKEWDEIINRSGVICTYKVWECSWFMLDAWGMIKRESTDRKNYICSEHIIVVDMKYFQGRCIWRLADSLGTECNLIYIIVEWNESCLCCVSLNGCRHFLPNITTFS